MVWQRCLALCKRPNIFKTGQLKTFSKVLVLRRPMSSPNTKISTEIVKSLNDKRDYRYR